MYRFAIMLIWVPWCIAIPVVAGVLNGAFGQFTGSIGGLLIIAATIALAAAGSIVGITYLVVDNLIYVFRGITPVRNTAPLGWWRRLMMAGGVVLIYVVGYYVALMVASLH